MNCVSLNTRISYNIIVLKTLSIKINPDNSLLSLMEDCNKLFNDYVDWSFVNKTYNKNRCHQETYKLFREQYPSIPSALVQSVRDTALEAVKSQKFKYRPFKNKHSAIRYDKRTLALRGLQLTISTQASRHKEILAVTSLPASLVGS